MKRVIFVAVISLFVSLAASGQQKYGYIYSEKVFKALPEYNSAIAKLEAYAQSASTHSEEMEDEVKKLYAQYLSVRSSMSTSQRQAQEKMLIEKEREANEYEEEFFAEDGPMSKYQKQLMDPIEQKVLNVVNRLAVQLGYDMIFDLSTVRSTIYQSERLDLTQMVIDNLNK